MGRSDLPAASGIVHSQQQVVHFFFADVFIASQHCKGRIIFLIPTIGQRMELVQDLSSCLVHKKELGSIANCLWTGEVSGGGQSISNHSLHKSLVNFYEEDNSDSHEKLI